FPLAATDPNNTLGPGGSHLECQVKLRLVAQPLNPHPGQPVAPGTQSEFLSDSALHLIYDIPPAQRDAIVRDLIAIKQASPVPTTGVPLGVHPGLADAASHASGQAYLTMVKKFILTYTSARMLKEVAGMGLNRGGAWVFFKGEVALAGAELHWS